MRKLSSLHISRVVALALPLLAAPAAAHAGLMIDLRWSNGGGKGVWPVFPGERVPFDVYAIVTGNSTGVEGFQSAQGAFFGVGSFVGRILPAGDSDEATFEVTLPALSPYNGNGAQRGESKHIGVTDGIVDLGDTPHRGEDLGNLVVFRANSMQVTSGAPIENGREFKIGHLEFLLEQVPTQGQAAINFAFRRGPSGEAVQSAALFRQDGTVSDGLDDISVGAPLTFTPEPAALAWLTLAGVLARRRSRTTHT